jgi:hypothetical protein
MLVDMVFCTEAESTARLVASVWSSARGRVMDWQENIRLLVLEGIVAAVGWRDDSVLLLDASSFQACLSSRCIGGLVTKSSFFLTIRRHRGWNIEVIGTYSMCGSDCNTWESVAFKRHFPWPTRVVWSVELRD